jgi:anthranilate synthase/aminodeoxychorismate synthase-like glutamine amidotransferase
VPHVLLIDNYDSFTYSIVHLLRRAGACVEVAASDRIRVSEVLAQAPDGLVIGPGPGRPRDAGLTLELIQSVAGRIPLLGVCLGHQAIAEHHLAKLTYVTRSRHGKRALIHHTKSGLFRGLSEPFYAACYHSLTIDPLSVKAPLSCTATCDLGEVMALASEAQRIHSIQFHPESVLSQNGLVIAKNWLDGL